MVAETFSGKKTEPALESCMRKCVYYTKMQRSTGVNGRISEHLLIRVVPPMISVPCGLNSLAVFLSDEYFYPAYMKQ